MEIKPCLLILVVFFGYFLIGSKYQSKIKSLIRNNLFILFLLVLILWNYIKNRNKIDYEQVDKYQDKDLHTTEILLELFL